MWLKRIFSSIDTAHPALGVGRLSGDAGPRCQGPLALEVEEMGRQRADKMNEKGPWPLWGRPSALCLPILGLALTPSQNSASSRKLSMADSTLEGICLI